MIRAFDLKIYMCDSDVYISGMRKERRSVEKQIKSVSRGFMNWHFFDDK